MVGTGTSGICSSIEQSPRHYPNKPGKGDEDEDGDGDGDGDDIHNHDKARDNIHVTSQTTP